ncbi:MAG: IS1634 family transposase [Synergistaceae bacterium]|nr:IS1634 family transposase [Synergistaceae bacterium]
MVKGIEYWVLVESKRINGKPRPVIIEYFGNTKNFIEKLMSNRSENKVLKSYSHGDTHALLKIVDKLGIESILDGVFKSKTRNSIKRSKSLLLIALQRVCSPGSKNEFEDWFKTTTLPDEMSLNPQVLTSQHFWEQMSDITETELMMAEDAITKKALEMYGFELEKIALDYTNYFSYISSTNDKCKIAQMGHNKQKRNDLKQYSMALITTKETGLPICSHIYEGNRNDQTEFYNYINLLKDRIPNYDPNVITLVFDGGGNNKKNFAEIETHYICAFSLSSCKNLYEKDISEYNEVEINDKVIKTYRCTQTIWGKERECIITFSNELYGGQFRELNQNIAKCINELQELNEKLSNKKSRISKGVASIQERVKKILSCPHMNKVIEIRLNTDTIVRSIEYLVNESQKVEIAHKYFGKKLIISDRAEWDTEEIIRTYRGQDYIEKIFRSTKDNEHFSIRPQYHWTDQKIRVHIFCCLLGLTLATVLQKEVQNQGINISKKQLLSKLSEIRRCWVKDKDSNKATNVMEEMDESQLQLWNAIQMI